MTNSSKTDKKKNCVILYGDDPVAMNQRKDEIINDRFKGQAPDPVIFDKEGTYETWLNQIGTSSLFTSDSVIVIKNPAAFHKEVKKASDKKIVQSFIDALKNLDDRTLVIFLYDEQRGNSDSKGKPDLRRKIWKELFDFCTTEEWSLIKPDLAGDIFTQMLSDRGLSIDGDAREYIKVVLSAWKTVSRPFLATECDKIKLICGDQKKVTKELLMNNLPDYMDQGIFNFKDQLLRKNTTAVMEGVDHVFTDQTATIINLGIISSRFRKIKMVKELMRARMSQMEMAKKLGLRNSWALKYLVRDARGITENDVDFFLTGLFSYQFRMRSSSQKGMNNFYLKDFLLRFCLRKGARSSRAPQ